MTEEHDLTDDETYASLLDLMRQLGLDWVADEVDEAARLGDLEVRDAPRQQPSPQDSLADLPELPGTPSLEAVRTPFAPRDRVHLAVEALRHVVVETAEMESEIRADLGTIVIVDDDANAVRQVIVRERTSPDAVARIDQMLTELETAE